MTGNQVNAQKKHNAKQTSAAASGSADRGGVIEFSCNTDGEIVCFAVAHGEDASPLPKMLNGSAMFRRTLREAVREWNQQQQPELLEAAPGLWLCAMPIINRRQRTGYEIAAVPTREFTESEQFISMCQTAARGGMDVELCRRQVQAATGNGIEQTAAMIRALHQERIAASDLGAQHASVTGQLAESYEELNLLYTITQNMTMRDPPERFISRCCQELLATLPYSWIGLQLIDRPQKLKSVSGRLILAGKPTHGMEVLRSKTRLAVQLLQENEPLVLDPIRNPNHVTFRPLGRAVAMHPVLLAGELIGAILACDKRGVDSDVSSIDIKMLGAAAAHTSIFLENAALYDDLNAMFLGTLEALTASIDAKDRYTCGHSRRVAHLTQLLAKEVGIDSYTVARCHIAGLVHDVGKIGVPEAVLLKPGKLTDEEFAWIRKHPEIGHRILKDIPQLADVLPGVLHHHERWDGRGYPHQVAGEAIPLMARLIGLADSFDAMSSNRTYRSALTREKVLEEVRKCAGTQFDPELAHRFVALDFTEYDQMVLEHKASDVVIAEQPPAMEHRRAA